MKNAQRIWRKIFLGAGGLLLLVVSGGLIGGCVMGPHIPKVSTAFAGRAPPEVRYYAVAGQRTLAAAETGRADGPLVVFIHGSPGDWEAFTGLLADLALGSRARLVSVDRLGWGESGHGELETSLAAQAAAIAIVLEAHPVNRPVILVGHSLGGPVAARLAMDRPDLVDGLILVAGSIDPEMEKTTILQKLARSPLLRWAVPANLLRADAEIKPLKGELEKMRPLWAHLRMPVTVIQGDTDGLVPRANADFAARMISPAQVEMIRVPKQGHLIPWERPDLIRNAVIKQLDLIALKKRGAS